MLRSLTTQLSDFLEERENGFKYTLLTLAIATLAMLMHSSVMDNGQTTLFTVTFNVTKEADSYNSFIISLCQRLAGGTYAGGVLMLIPKKMGHNQSFHIGLMSGNNQITHRIQNGDV